MTIQSNLPKAALGLLLVLALAACGTSGPRGGRGRAMAMGGGAMMGAFGGAGPRAEPAALFLAGLDADLDTMITPQELSASLNRLWASGDANGDQTLSILELNEWRLHWFGSSDGWPGQFHFDADGNGSLSHKEFDAGLKTVFAAFDANKDGRLDRAELLSTQPGREKKGDQPQLVKPGGPAPGNNIHG